MKEGADMRVKAAVVLIAAALAATLVSACTESSSTVTTSPDSAGKCGLTLTAPPPMAADGGSAAITVATQPECAWTASTAASWISGVSPASSQGSGTVSFQVAANDGSASREAEVVVNASSVRVSQRAQCRFEVSPSSQTLDFGGGSGSLAISAAGECGWNASADASWISLAAPLSGSGNGTLRFTVAPNGGPERSGTITVGGLRATIFQASGSLPSCSYSISPMSQNFAPPGGAGDPLEVSTQAACQWTASSNAAWITLISGATGLGNGTVAFSVGVNAGASRTGSLTVAGRAITVTQAACSFSLAGNGLDVASAGGPATIAVTTSSTCAWTATSNTGWITITSGGTAVGNGSVGFNVAANSGASRTGSLTIAGRAFTVNQAGCSYSLSGNGLDVAAPGGPATVAVTTGSTCPWTASSNAGWITITSGGPGAGNGSVVFSIAANSGASRTGSLTIAGRAFTVNQAAGSPPVSCSYSVGTNNLTVEAAGGPATIAVTTGSTCTWTASSNAGWITVTSGASGTGNGTVTISVARNTDKDRKGTLTIAGKTVTIEQKEEKKGK
jgi:hypothetical protein